MTAYSVMLAVVSVLLGTSPAGVASAGPGRAPKATAVLDLNTASLAELLEFDGIGRMYAEKIYHARPFRARAELVNRRILPVSVYLAIKYRLYTSPLPAESADDPIEPIPAGMADLNRATVDELARIPGIGIQYAERIARGRPYRTEYDLIGRRILPPAVFNRVQSMIAVQR